MAPLRLFGFPLHRGLTLRRRTSAVPVPPVPLAELAALSPTALLARLSATAAGLTNHEAAERYGEFGPNAIGDERPPGAWRQLALIVANPLSLMLLALAVVSFATGQRKGAVAIAAMVALSSLLSFVQEYRAGRAAESLKALVHTKATVLRPLHRDDPEAAAHPVHVPLAHIVPGDVVLLAAGNVIPADVRVLVAKDLFVDESALTGESLPVEKSAACGDAGQPIADIRCLALTGSHVTSGTGTAVVLATGARTAFAGIARETVAPRAATSFDVGVHRYLKLILVFMAVMVPAVLLINGFARGDWHEAFLFAVAVAAGMTPEMLPMVVTVNLAKGARAMAGKRVIVKRLVAIQNFGAMNVLCTDKTGTLTQDRVLLERHVDITGSESRRVLEFACLNSRFQSGLPNLLDAAVLAHGDLHPDLRAGAGYARIDEIPFDFERRRMSVVVEQQATGAHLLICKGAVEEVAAACDRVERDGSAKSIEPAHADELSTVTRELNDDGFRVIAIAYKQLPPGPATYTAADERALVLLGYIAFLDPPKESAGEAIAALTASGIAVKVLTGDNAAVARHVCRQVGLRTDVVLGGADVDALDDAALAARAETATLFAKLAPQQKARVIRALRAHGNVVGYLGDGINDGPALTAADIGISVDTGADVARDAADLILLEKSLNVLAAGVREGRRVFGNVTKYVRMAGSSNFGNMLSMVGASALLPFLPMAPVQILVNNLLYDVSQTALATDEVDADFLARPRQWDIGGIGRYMLCIGPVSSLFDYATFGVLVWGFGALDDPALFQTGWFVESLLSQTLIVHVIRTGRIPFVESRPSLALLAMTAAVAVLGLALPFSPVAGALGLVPLPLPYFGALAAIIVGYVVLTQTVKTWAIRKFRLD
ncbi:MAG: magnesium-translocating P-type ATPase [Betaproteobacteria bacterium]